MSAAAAASSREAALSKAASALATSQLARAEANVAKRASRLSAKPQPEVHLLGELCGATGFGPGVAVTAKWALEAGEAWMLLEGAAGGQTQTDTPDAGSDAAVWGHPLDAHYAVGAPQGWPRLVVQVWALDAVGRLEIAGYGVAALPAAPGCHELTIPTWRPLGTPAQEAAAFFVGGAPALRTTAVASSAAGERYRLVTAGAGSVHVRVDVVTRHLELYQVES